MHSLTIWTRFTFGDHVMINSPTQKCFGTGKIFSITITMDREIYYMVELDGETNVQPGLMEREISLLKETTDSY